MLLGNLSIDLEYPRNTKEVDIAEELDNRGLACSTCHFRQRHHRKVFGRWTWRQ